MVDSGANFFKSDLSAEGIGEILRKKTISPYTKIMFLSTSLPTQFKELSRSYYLSLLKGEQNQYQRMGIAFNLDMLDELFPNITGKTLSTHLESRLKYLPLCSWILNFRFKLKTPYISRDDTSFYIIDNPVRKDKIFKIPMVSPSQWKGSLHGVMVRRILIKVKDKDVFFKKRVSLINLFGDESRAVKQYLNELMQERFQLDTNQINWELGRLFETESIDKFFKVGRLRFYPSFFNDIGLDVINPHNRVKKIGINPIYFETAPSGAEAHFRLLYAPVDLMGKPEEIIKKRVSQDLKGIGDGLSDLFTFIGFGSKISNGFGIAAEDIKKGMFVGKGFDFTESGKNTGRCKPQMPDMAKDFLSKYTDTDFSMPVREFSSNKKKKAEFRKAKERYERYQRDLKAYEEDVKKHQNRTADQTGIAIQEVGSFKSIGDIFKEISRNLREKSNGSL